MSDTALHLTTGSTIQSPPWGTSDISTHRWHTIQSSTLNSAEGVCVRWKVLNWPITHVHAFHWTALAVSCWLDSGAWLDCPARTSYAHSCKVNMVVSENSWQNVIYFYFVPVVIPAFLYQTFIRRNDIPEFFETEDHMSSFTVFVILEVFARG